MSRPADSGASGKPHGRPAAWCAFTSAMFVLLASCTLPSLQPGRDMAGTLLLSFRPNQARTLQPGIDMGIARYEITGIGPDGSIFELSTGEASLRTGAVTAGQWTISVSAKNAEGAVIGRGSATGMVVAGASTSLSILIAPLSGTGAIDLSVTWPAGDVVSPAIEAQLVPTAGAALPLSFSVSPGAGRCHADGIPAGYYTLSLRLMDGASLAMGAVEIARIVKDQITTGSFAFPRLNKAAPSIMVGITPQMCDPLSVSFEGHVASLFPGASMTVIARVVQPVENVTCVWYLNGEPRAAGTELSFSTGGALPIGAYRLDATVFSADGSRAGSATHEFSVRASSSTVSLRPVDGGPDYYARWPNSFTTDPSYFPIGVWFESVLAQADVDKDRDAGINLYVALTGNSDLRVLAANGMRAILQADEWASRATAPGSQAIAGWLLADEIDMLSGPVAGPARLAEILAGLPAGDGRIRYNNYGKGVMFTTWETDQQAARFVNDFQDVVSADLYWFTDESLHSFSQGGTLLGDGVHDLTEIATHRAANYGATIDRVRSLIAPAGSKPVWNYVELGHPSSETAWPSITPPEVSAAVWSGIIHGARGIVYFNHSFGGPFMTQHVLREAYYADIRAEVQRTNARITELAPVLNAPFADGLVSTSAMVDVAAKYHDGAYYLIAGSRSPTAHTASFSLTDAGNAEVTVLYENRTIAVRDGTFVDTFADGNAVHLYRIDGASP